MTKILKTNKLIVMAVYSFLELLQHLYTASNTWKHSSDCRHQYGFLTLEFLYFPHTVDVWFSDSSEKKQNLRPQSACNITVIYSLRDTYSDYRVNIVLLGVLH
jgi:hypothetical protein